MTHPYQSLPGSAFWRTAVAEKHALHIEELWNPKFQVLPNHRIVTAGSCFAQHIGKALERRGYQWLNAEPAPSVMTDEEARRFNFGVFSFRTGNIYTARMLRQWVELAFDRRELPDDYWQFGNRVYDPLRPAIEPNGFFDVADMLKSRQATLAGIRRAVRQADVFVFTLGLTESWQNHHGGYEYAACPGTQAGEFDADRDRFENQSFGAIHRDLKIAIRLIKRKNPGIKILLTVSPVPLTATASGAHVLVATSQSKAILRAVASEVVANDADVDYFPSYEIITSPAFEGRFFDTNKRSVIPEGVSHVMETFFRDQARTFGEPAIQKPQRAPSSLKNTQTHLDVICEEEMLDAFAR